MFFNLLPTILLLPFHQVWETKQIVIGLFVRGRLILRFRRRVIVPELSAQYHIYENMHRSFFEGIINIKAV